MISRFYFENKSMCLDLCILQTCQPALKYSSYDLPTLVHPHRYKRFYETDIIKVAERL